MPSSNQTDAIFRVGNEEYAWKNSQRPSPKEAGCRGVYVTGFSFRLKGRTRQRLRRIVELAKQIALPGPAVGRTRSSLVPFRELGRELSLVVRVIPHLRHRAGHGHVERHQGWHAQRAAHPGLARRLASARQSRHGDRKSTRLNSSHLRLSRMPSSA